MKIEITREDAEKLIENYCYETPLDGSVERIMAINPDDLIPNDWVEVIEGLGLKQSELDAILDL